ncbi:helix-turn-helix transcriptional regulator [Pseudomaricurvus hydrocarbonicus]
MVYSYIGVLEVTTPSGRYLIPPNRAVWVPPDVVHEVSSLHGAEISSLYLDANESASLSTECCVIHVRPLLKELIIAALEMGDQCDWDGPGGRLFRTLHDQLSAAESEPVYLPLPTDQRLLKICTHLQAHPEDNRTIEQWSETVGASIRTLQRLFKKETKLSFQGWRQQLRVQIAQQRLAEDGVTITQVAGDLGYESSSAFIAMFKQNLGMSPGEFMKAIRCPKPSTSNLL